MRRSVLSSRANGRAQQDALYHRDCPREELLLESDLFTTGAYAARSAEMAPIPVVQARTLEHLSELLRGTHLRFDELCSQFGLPDVRLDREDCFVPLREALMIEEEIARATGDELLGLHLAERSGLGALGRHGLYITAASTLGEAIERANSHLSDHMIGARLLLIPSGPNVLWCYELSARVLIGRRHSNLFSLTLMRDLVRLAAGRNWLPHHVRFEESPLDGTDDLHRAFGPSLIWGSTMAALAFRKELLDLPLVRGRSSHASQEWHAAEDRSTRLQSEFVESLKRLVRSLLPAGHLNLTLLTRFSGISARSLQRQLDRRGRRLVVGAECAGSPRGMRSSRSS